MRCSECKGETQIERGRYHYTESGLDNVYLENVEVRICPECGAISALIPRIEELHQVIGQAIGLQKERLSGKEVRYLRKQLGIKAKDWANYIKVDAATLSRWENGLQVISEQSDALVRHVYFRILADRQGLQEPESLVEKIAALEQEQREASQVVIKFNSRRAPSRVWQSESLAA